jgi:hypothetical protein
MFVGREQLEDFPGKLEYDYLGDRRRVNPKKHLLSAPGETIVSLGRGTLYGLRKKNVQSD